MDPDTDRSVVLSQPDTDPERWNRYLDAAQQRYRRHGAEAVDRMVLALRISDAPPASVSSRKSTAFEVSAG